LERTMTRKNPIKIVALGDSLTVGFQAPSEFLEGSEEYPYNHFLEIILDRELPGKGLGDLEVLFTNAGLLGDTTRGMLERFESHVASKNPDYVIVWGGINDLMTLYLTEKIFKNLETIYTKAREKKIEPIACTLTPTLGLGDGAENHLAVAQLHLTLEGRPNTEPFEQAAWHLREGGPRVYKGVHLFAGGKSDSDGESTHGVSRRHGDGADRAGGLQVLYVVRISMGHSDADAPQDPRDLVLGHPR